MRHTRDRYLVMILNDVSEKRRGQDIAGSEGPLDIDRMVENIDQVIIGLKSMSRMPDGEEREFIPVQILLDNAVRLVCFSSRRRYRPRNGHKVLPMPGKKTAGDLPVSFTVRW
jgi:hypothetical protein